MKELVWPLEADVGEQHICYCHMGFVALTKQQRFQTQGPHFVHFAWHQWHSLDMSHLREKPHGWLCVCVCVSDENCDDDASSHHSPWCPRSWWGTHHAGTQLLMADVGTRCFAAAGAAGGDGRCWGRRGSGSGSRRPARWCSARRTAVRWR